MTSGQIFLDVKKDPCSEIIKEENQLTFFKIIIQNVIQLDINIQT